MSHFAVHDENRLHFDTLLAHSEDAIISRFSEYEMALWGGVGLFNASNHVDRSEWREYVDSINIDRNMPGISGIGYIDLVNENDVDSYLTSVREDGVPSFKNFPKTDLEEKLIIKYIEPIEANKEALGLDIGFEENRKRAANFAKKTGYAVLTEKIQLVQDEEKTPGFLFLLPLYEEQNNPSGAEDEKSKFRGWVFAPFVAKHFLADITKYSNNQLNFKVYDGSSTDPEALIYQSVSDDVWETNYETIHYDQIGPIARTISVANNTALWTIEWKTSPYFVPFSSETRALWVFAVGFIFSVVFGGLIFLIYQLYGGAAKELIKEKQYSDYLITKNPALIIGISPLGVIRNVNDKVERLTGYTKEEMIGEDLASLLFPDEHIGRIKGLMQYFDGERGVSEHHTTITTKDGQKRTINWTTINRFDNEGELEEIVGFGVDVTLRLEYEDQILAAKEEAEKANQSKSDFLAGMSHEIRTPMNGVIGTASLLSETELNSKQKKYIEIIKSSGQTLLEIINEVLDYSKLDAEKLEIHKEIFALKEAIEEQSTLLQPLAQEKSLKYTLEIDEHLPDFLVSDATRIKQILTNFISNAIKFTERGEITIRAQLQGNKIIKFSVTDTGIGIPEEQQERVFEAFEQVIEGRKAAKTAGTGLGLAISKRLAEMMGGEVGLLSSVGAGSTFWFTIAVEVPDLKDVEAMQAQATQEKLDEQGANFGLNILVVEDVITNQFVITDMLENMGCAVSMANNGQEAIEMIQEDSYDMVFMDCNMPVMDGFEATQAIREELGMKDMFIVALTANALRGDKEKCLEAGMNDFVSKPIDKKDIVRVLNDISNNEQGVKKYA